MNEVKERIKRELVSAITILFENSDNKPSEEFKIKAIREFLERK